MKRLTAFLDRFLEMVLSSMMGVMVIVVTWQVITRYLLNRPSSYTEELATYLLIWISLLGAAYALRQKAHLGIDILTRRLEGTARRFSTVLIQLGVIAFSAAILVYGGSRLVYLTLKLNQVSAAFQVPVGYVYTVIPLSGLLMIVYAVAALMERADGEDESSRPVSQ